MNKKITFDRIITTINYENINYYVCGDNSFFISLGKILTYSSYPKKLTYDNTIIDIKEILNESQIEKIIILFEKRFKVEISGML